MVLIRQGMAVGCMLHPLGDVRGIRGFCFSLLTLGAFGGSRCLADMTRNEASHPSSFANEPCISAFQAPPPPPPPRSSFSSSVKWEPWTRTLWVLSRCNVGCYLFLCIWSISQSHCFRISCYLSSKISSMLKCNEKLQNEIFQNIMFYQRTRQ